MERKLLMKSAGRLAADMRDFGDAQIPSPEKWADPDDNPGDIIYRAVCLIMMEHVEEVFGGCFPEEGEAKQILVGADPYFEQLFQDGHWLSQFRASCDFVREAWDDDYRNRKKVDFGLQEGL
jgi:hypothetical protein